MQPEVTAIVVSWNVADALNRCLKSLEHSAGVAVTTVVVDNASSDGSAEMVRREFPQVTLIANPTNRGFAAAVNQGLDRSHGDVVLLNPDVVLEPFTIAELQAALVRHTSVGIVGGQLRYPDATIQPSVKRFPRVIDLFLILVKLPNLFPGISRRYNGLDIDYGKEQIVDQVMGSCYMIRQACRDAVGKFDEGFYLWFEEVDFCYRARDKGWLTLYAPHARALHRRGTSFGQLSAVTKQRLLRNSINHYCYKHFGVLAMIVLAPGQFVSWSSAMLIDALKLTKPSKAKNL